jgi:dephospho-coA kinase
LLSIFKNGATLQKFPNAYVITGSIASGKSTVVNLLKERGFSVIDADLIAHEQLEICKGEIIREFGEQILDEAGKIDRKKLGAIVFREPKKLKNLEQILHPKIKAEIFFKASQLESLGQVYFVDIPLFFEKKERYAEFKNVAVIYAPKELLLSRLMSRNGLNLEEAKARVELQMDIEQKREMANFLIDNSSDRENLELELEKFLKQIGATAF